MSNNAKKKATAKSKRPGPRKIKPAAVGKTNIGVGKSGRVSVAKPNRNAMSLMQQKLTGQEAGVASYLLGLSTPSLPCRVPVVLGEFELDTNTYSYVFNGTFSCTASGFGYVAACADGWKESGNDAGPTSQYCAATTGGKPLWYTPAGSAATTTIAGGAAADASNTAVTLPKLDQAFTTSSRYRMTSIILSIWPDSPATTTQGDVTVAVAGSEQAIADSALNSATFASIAAYPQEYVTHLEMPLANWNPEHQAHAFPVPFSENCFVIQYMPTTGTAVAGDIVACAVVSGAASGQTIRYRVEYKYETTAPLTYLTGVENIVTGAPVSSAELVPHLAALRPMAVAKAPAKALPALPLNAIKQASPPLFDKVVASAQALTKPIVGGLGKAVGSVVSGAIKHIPYVGGLLSGAFDSLFG